MKLELLIRHPHTCYSVRCYVYSVCGRTHTNATATRTHLYAAISLGLRQPKPLSNFQQPSLKQKRNYNLEKCLVLFVFAIVSSCPVVKHQRRWSRFPAAALPLQEHQPNSGCPKEPPLRTAAQTVGRLF